jgi:PAS domain S-box-containing protein
LQFLEVNDTALQLYGYSREELLKMSIYDIRLEEEHDKIKNQLSTGEYQFDKTIRTHRKRNGELMQVEPTISEITYKGRQVYLVTITDKTEKIRIQEELNQAKISKQKEIMDAQEQSRSEIARELHDNINQLLVAASLYFKVLQPLTEKDQQLKKTCIGIVGSAIDEIRKLSAALVTPTLKDISLKESIEYLSKSLEMIGATPVIRTRIREDMMPEGFKVNIYRIIQEQLNNIIKYAEATKVQIDLLQKGNLVRLQVSDNGKGFDQKKKSGGIGFKNISYRAELYNGQVQVKSGIGAGCKLSVEFRLAPI